MVRLVAPSAEFDLHSFAQSLTWQSKRADPTGFVWMGARYYDPCGGRFLSPDPIGHPFCLDLYAYANGDPINYIDPDGRFASAAYNTVAPISINYIKASLPEVIYRDEIEGIILSNGV